MIFVVITIYWAACVLIYPVRRAYKAAGPRDGNRPTTRTGALAQTTVAGRVMSVGDATWTAWDQHQFERLLDGSTS